MPEIRQARNQRDAGIVEQFKQTKSIMKTCRAFNSVYSREIVRRAITKAGLYSRCKRDAEAIKRAEKRINRRCYADRHKSKTHRVELKMQGEMEKNFMAFGINFKREMLVPGCQMRADFCGDNWAIETKVNCDSQSMMVGMAQCMVYRKHLNKQNVCLIIPDDIDPRDFYKSECEANGVAVVKLSNLIWWINSLGTDA
jgi:hypothetical protein